MDPVTPIHIVIPLSSSKRREFSSFSHSSTSSMIIDSRYGYTYKLYTLYVCIPQYLEMPSSVVEVLYKIPLEPFGHAELVFPGECLNIDHNSCIII